MTVFKKNIFSLYATVAFFEVLGIIMQIKPIHFVLKPALMPILILAILMNAGLTGGKNLMIGALLFSFFGDVLLLAADSEQVFFILGLCCFLLAHIFYIIYFIRENKPGKSFLAKYPYVIILIMLYIGSLLWLLLPGLGELKIPVIVYACVIGSMVCFSLNLSYAINRRSRQQFAQGALFFVISDTILAIDKFYMSFTAAAALIMITYCIAQYLIVKAFLKRRN